MPQTIGGPGDAGLRPEGDSGRPPRRARRRFAVVGVGAIGGFYGARLAAAGAEVHWLVRSDADQLRRDGLRVASVDGDLELTGLAVHTAAAQVPPVDVILLATKTTAIAQALPSVAAIAATSSAAGRAPSVVCMQNGFGVEDAVAAGLASDVPVIGGMCFICAVKEAPGLVRHLDYGAVTLAGRTSPVAPPTAALGAVAQEFEAAGIATDVASDLIASRWRKLVWNVPFNGLSVVLDAGTDEIMTDPQAYALAEALMGEVVAASVASGHPVSEEVVPVMLRATAAMSPYDTSMRVDYAARRPLEIDAIYRAPVAAAQAVGADMPRTEALTQQLAFLDRRNRCQPRSG